MEVCEQISEKTFYYENGHYYNKINYNSVKSKNYENQNISITTKLNELFDDSLPDGNIIADIIQLFDTLNLKCNKMGLIFYANLNSKISKKIFGNSIAKESIESIMRIAIKNPKGEFLHKDFAYNKNFYEFKKIILSIFDQLTNQFVMNKFLNLEDNKYNILLSPNAASYLIHEILGHPLEYDYVSSNNSIYTLNDLHMKKFPKFINIFNSSNKLETLGIKFGKYDDESNLIENTHIIKDGEIVNFIKTKRNDYVYNKPLYRMYNFYLDQCLLSKNINELIKNIKKGILIENILGGGVNPFNGMFYLNCGISKFINEGNIIGNVKNFQIVDNLAVLQNQILEIGNDLAFSIGRCIKHGQIINVGMGSPSIIIQSLSIVK